MKKIIVTLILLSNTVLFSQVTFKPGIRAGINSSTIMNLSNGHRTRIYAGLFGEFRFGQRYALQPEIVYSMQGSKDVELNYLSIGHAHKFFIGRKDPFYFVIASGIDIYLNGLQSFSDEYDSNPKVNTDLTFSAGFGYDFPFGLGIEARYKQGVIDLEYHDDYIIELPLTGNLNSVIQIGVSYKFDFKKESK